MKIKKPIIHQLNENNLEVVEGFYQCLFNRTPLDIIEIKNNTIDECKFEKIDFGKINLILILLIVFLLIVIYQI